MKIRSIVIATALALGTFSGIGVAVEDHRVEATSHVQAAIHYGEIGHVELLVQHAEEALKHSEEVNKEKRNSVLEFAIAQLEAAIYEGKKNHLRSATELMKDVLERIKPADKKRDEALIH